MKENASQTVKQTDGLNKRVVLQTAMKQSAYSTGMNLNDKQGKEKESWCIQYAMEIRWKMEVT